MRGSKQRLETNHESHCVRVLFSLALVCVAAAQGYPDAQTIRLTSCSCPRRHRIQLPAQAALKVAKILAETSSLNRLVRRNIGVDNVAKSAADLPLFAGAGPDQQPGHQTSRYAKLPTTE